MDKLVVQGGHRLRGALQVSGSKNTALPLMAGALLADGVTTLANVPDLRDVHTFARVIAFTGAEPSYDASRAELRIDAGTVERDEAPYELVKRMRASFYMLGALLGRMGTARVSLPGGCAWGPRPVNLHIEGMKALGATVDLDEGYVVAKAAGGRMAGGRFRLEPSSVGATINLLLAAATARGPSRIENAAREPDVVVFGNALNAMGARVQGLGTEVIEVEGVDRLEPIDFANCADRIELGTFIIAAAIAGEPGGTVRIDRAQPDHLGAGFLDALERTGTGLKVGPSWVEVLVPTELQPVSIETGIYPGFPTDLQAQWTILLTRSRGNAKVVDRVYRDRFKHIPELQRMGLNAIVVDNEVVIEGACQLKGAKVMSTDLRASVSLVLAGMIAEGETHVLRVYHLDRGYENLEGKLSGAGIAIERQRYDEFADPQLSAAALDDVS